MGWFSKDKKWSWFTEDEVKGLDPKFVTRLDNARSISMVPYKITSGYRSPEGNEEVGGVKASAHTKGLGVDLACADSHQRFRILKGLFAIGLTRIGIYDRHIHVDDDSVKPQEVAWWGTSK